MRATIAGVAALYLASLSLSGVAIAESYLCVPDQASAFVYDEPSNRWRPQVLSPMVNKYLVKASPDPTYAWLVISVGGEIPLAWCKDDFTSKDGLAPKDSLVCHGFSDFRMNKKTNRFLAVYSMGYWLEDERSKYFDKNQKPMMEIGRCSAL